jgi:hypothetical protein
LAFFTKAQKVKSIADEQTPPLPSNQAKAMFILAYITWALVFVFFCIVIFLRDRIAIAIEVVKEAARAIEDMRLIVNTSFLLHITIYTPYSCHVV